MKILAALAAVAALASSAATAQDYSCYTYSPGSTRCTALPSYTQPAPQAMNPNFGANMIMQFGLQQQQMQLQQQQRLQLEQLQREQIQQQRLQNQLLQQQIDANRRAQQNSELDANDRENLARFQAQLDGYRNSSSQTRDQQNAATERASEEAARKAEAYQAQREQWQAEAERQDQALHNAGPKA